MLKNNNRDRLIHLISDITTHFVYFQKMNASVAILWEMAFSQGEQSVAGLLQRLSPHGVIPADSCHHYGSLHNSYVVSDHPPASVAPPGSGFSSNLNYSGTRRSKWDARLMTILLWLCIVFFLLCFAIFWVWSWIINVSVFLSLSFLFLIIYLIIYFYLYIYISWLFYLLCCILSSFLSSLLSYFLSLLNQCFSCFLS